ncbi:transglutaminase-like putative cysteine protease [Pseudorhizobium tarimense]|uniref:Transglutaminase-like putative cysteine protease n=1 Tax=Pseudorhizobium tarimense TaxID=1079109 RepID=A0ABV2H6M2_9HYPH|nr:transglutaminase family protein [Pseudorhizobium tarimense]MCJ8519499.1 transglutaminase family protein [Pseudorhizobium tarimense]
MRLTITHSTQYLYDQPVSYVLQRLRLTPVDGPTQRVLNWSIQLEGAKVETGYADQYGNRVELTSVEGSAYTIRIVASGEVKTIDTSGVFGQHQGFCPLWLFLRETPQTKAGKLVREINSGLAEDDGLARMHALMNAIHKQVAYVPGATDSETTAEQALEAGRGVCQDHAHIMISAARLLGNPARYVSGYLMMEGVAEQVATHAWAEVHLPGLGWIGFDAANNICPDERYVRIASGLSYRDAAPVSGLRIGSANEDLHVAVTVEPTVSQQQSQS